MTAIAQVEGCSASAQTSGIEVYNPYGNSWFSNTNSVTTETQSQITYRTAGTVTNLWCNVPTNTINADCTLNLRKNGADGNNGLSIPTSTTGTFEDTTHSDTVTAGDELSLLLDVNGSSGNILVTTASSLFAASADTTTHLAAYGNASFSIASTSHFLNLSGQNASANTVENSANQYFGVGGTLKNLFVYINTNARTTTTTVQSRKNGGNGNLTVSIGSTATGVFEDTSNSDTISATDVLCTTFVTGTGTGSITPKVIATEFLTTDSKSVMFAGRLSTGWDIAFGITRYLSVGGAISSPLTTESQTYTKALANFTLSNLSVYVSANTVNGADTVTLIKNGSTTALTVSVTSSTTGRFTDTSNTVSIVSTDTINLRAVTAGSSGTQTWTSTSMSATYGGSPTTAVRDMMQRGFIPFSL